LSADVGGHFLDKPTISYDIYHLFHTLANEVLKEAAKVWALKVDHLEDPELPQPDFSRWYRGMTKRGSAKPYAPF
jgi:hypothetical protein